MFRLRLLTFLLALPFTFFRPAAAIAQITSAGDNTGTVVNQNGNNFSITGGSLSSDGGNLFHNFADLNLNASQSATFNANPDIQNILSRISGGNPSFIDGLLQISGSDANLFLLNPAGLVFGNNAQLNIGGDFTASTAWGLGFDQEIWTNGTDYNNLVGSPTQFLLDGTGAIINAGDLNAGQNQGINLFAANVVNTGRLTTKAGTIQIVAVPDSSTLRLNQAGQILGLEIDAPASGLTTTNLPELLTGDSVETGLTLDNGNVILKATATEISLNSGNTFISGELNTSGDRGGNIHVFGQDINLVSANLDAAGQSGGGEILVGGDYQGQGDRPRALNTTINQNSILNASAQTTGDGGKIIAWADETTQFFGTALARGGSQSGDGGFVETSGKLALNVTGGTVDTSAINGETGQWLLDPIDILIDPALAGTISTNLGTTDVELSTAGAGVGGGDITLDATITSASGNDLTLTSRRFIYTSGDIDLTGDLTFNLNAVNAGTATALQLGDSIQAANDAINIVSGEKTINLGAGTFQNDSFESLFFDQDLTLSGAGQGVTIIDGGNGVIRTINNDLIISNLTIQNGDSSFGDGGGIYGIYSDLTITDATITGNNAYGRGGGISASYGTVTLTNSTVSNNTASGFSGGNGGGISNASGLLTLSGTTISGNTAANNGGGIHNDGSGTLDLVNSTISGNTATNDGGGIYNDGDTTIRNSTIANNSAAVNNGGGIFNSAGDIILGNSIVADSVAGGDIRGDLGTVTTTGNNIIEESVITGAGIQNVDPLLTPLGNYGGTTQTHFFSPNSVAIDGGDDAIAVGLVADQRGGDRVVDAVDIGAVEFQGLELTLVSGGTQSTPVNTSFEPVVARAEEVTFNNPLGDLTVDFDAPNSGASANPTSLSGVTNAAGIVSVTPTANDTAGSFELNATTQRFEPVNDPSADLTNTNDLPEIPEVEEVPEVGVDCITGAGCLNEQPLETPSFDGTGEVAETNIVEIQDTLKIKSEQTGVKLALIYAFFQPPEVAATEDSNGTAGVKDNLKIKSKAQQQDIQWQFRGDRLSDFLNAEERFFTIDEELSDDDVLELVMITSTGKIIRQQVPDATRGKVMAQAQNFVQGVTSPRFRDSYLGSAQSLYDVFLRPLEADLQAEEIDNLTYVMDDGLRALPIAALHDGQQFLVENYSLGMMPSFSLTNTSGYIEPSQNLLLAMGASEFTDAEDLPAASLEAKIIAEDIWQGDALVNQRFTVENLLNARARKPYGIVHLATHGEFRSGVAGEAYIQFKDQKVSLEELEKLQLGTPPIELLVLSACRTAFGDRSAELGFAGLAIASGAKSAIGSIWYVDDAATMGLMTSLYNELQITPIKAQALQNAQLTLLRGETSQEGGKLVTKNGPIDLPAEYANTGLTDLSHPYYWSGFTIIGNPW
ncbi:MAG: CHAT domain-containing protein [Limnothrix sp.]